MLSRNSLSWEIIAGFAKSLSPPKQTRTRRNAETSKTPPDVALSARDPVVLVQQRHARIMKRRINICVVYKHEQKVCERGQKIVREPRSCHKLDQASGCEYVRMAARRSCFPATFVTWSDSSARLGSFLVCERHSSHLEGILQSVESQLL